MLLDGRDPGVGGGGVSGGVVRVEERFEFRIEIGGGWGRAGASTSIVISQRTYTYAVRAILAVTTAVEAPWGGRVELYFNGIKVTEGNPLSGSWDVTQYLSANNTLSIEIVAPLSIYWVGGTQVRGYLSVHCEYPDKSTAQAASAENQDITRTYSIAGGQSSYAQSPLGGLAGVLEFMPVIVSFGLAMALLGMVTRFTRGD